MFLDINIPVVPIEIWLRVTHNQRPKTPKVASVLLFRYILTTKSWLECGSSLLNSRMSPGILRDVPFSIWLHDDCEDFSRFVNYGPLRELCHEFYEKSNNKNCR